MRAIRYAFEEATRSLWRGRRASLLSTATIALAVLVLGAFLLVAANLERLGAEWSNAAEISVYLDDSVTSDERAAIERVIAAGPVVAGSEYVSKADALRRFKQTFGDLSSTIDGLGDNPLPASYEVRLRPGGRARAGVEALGSTLRQTRGVVDVRDDQQWLDRLRGAIAIIRGVGLALGALLSVAAALTVANVVRLALYARRDEIEIMQLVGAPSAYIRGPFVMEGLLQGGLGALAALAVLAAGFAIVRAEYLAPLASMLGLPPMGFLPPRLWGVLVAGGLAVGAVGGLFASWRPRRPQVAEKGKSAAARFT